VYPLHLLGGKVVVQSMQRQRIGIPDGIKGLSSSNPFFLMRLVFTVLCGQRIPKHIVQNTCSKQRKDSIQITHKYTKRSSENDAKPFQQQVNKTRSG
jgi:hypothetical protein